MLFLQGKLGDLLSHLAWHICLVSTFLGLMRALRQNPIETWQNQDTPPPDDWRVVALLVGITMVSDG